MEKVVIKLDDEWHGNSTETLWVIPWFTINKYQVRNIPFYAKGISLDDIIEANEIEGVKYFLSVVKSSGHSTYRVFLRESISEDIFDLYWMPLKKIGCTYEKAFNRFYSIDVPADTDIHDTYSLLADGEKNHIWDFEEGNVGHVLS
jgi:hypothetical protein